MKKRPKIFTWLSLIFLLYTPITLIIATLKLDLPFTWTLGTLKLTFNSPYVFYYWFIPALISLSLIKMRKFSYPIFMISQFLALILPLTSKSLFIPELLSESSITIYCLQAIAFLNIALFTKKDHIALFFNNSLRPWEWAKRIDASIPLSIKTKEAKHIIDATTANISSSGLLFFCNNELEIFSTDQKLLVNLSFEDCEISLPIKVIRLIEKNGITHYGAKFNHRGIWQYYQLKRLISRLPYNKGKVLKFEKKQKQLIKKAA